MRPALQAPLGQSVTRAESLGEGKRGRGTVALLVSVTGEKNKGTSTAGIKLGRRTEL